MGANYSSGTGNDVSDIPVFELLENTFSQLIALNHQLNGTTSVLQADKCDFPHVAFSHHAPGDREFLYYTSHGIIEGIRSGDMKLLVKKPREKANNQTTKVMLFDLGADIGEQHNLAESRPETVEKLRTRMEELDNEITMNARAPWQKE